MPHPRLVGGGGVVELVPGGEVEEGEAPTIITTLAKGTAMEEGLVATPTLAKEVGVVGEEPMEHRNKAMGKLIIKSMQMYLKKMVCFN